MKTTDLIAALAADRTAVPAPGRALAHALLPGVAISMILYLWLVGWRDDIGSAASTTRFGLKVLLNAALVVTAIGLVLRLACPGRRATSWMRALWSIPAVLLVAIAVELMVLPGTQWSAAAHGHNSMWCLTCIPALGLGPLLAGIWGLRAAAPEKPAFAGAIMGLAAAGISGTLYALHCTDDSPLFVAIWYSLAAAFLSLLGAVLGARMLRW